MDPNRLTEKAQEALRSAQSTAVRMGHQQIDVEHLLSALLDQEQGLVPAVLNKADVSPEALKVRVQQELERLPRISGQGGAPDQFYVSGRFNALMTRAEDEAKRFKDEYVSVEHLLLAMTDDGGPAGRMLKEFGVTRQRLLSALQQVRGRQRVTSQNPEETYQALERYGRDLTQYARQGKLDPVIGRDEEIRRVIQVLSRRTKNNPVLIGEPGVGNLLKPMLARGELHCIGATPLDEYRKHIEKDAALERRFQPVFVDQPSVEDTISILRGLKERYEVHHGVRIQDAALVAAAVLSNRYVTGRFLPDKAIDLVDEAASRLRIEIDSMPTEIDVVERRMRQLEIERVALAKETDAASKERLDALDQELAELREQASAMKAHWEAEKEAIDRIRVVKEELEQKRIEQERETDLEHAAEIRYGQIPQLERRVEEATEALDVLQSTQRMLKEEVDEEDIAEVVSKWTGIPVSKLMEGEVQKLIRMEDVLHERVIGQEEAVEAVANAIRRSRAGLSDPNKPIGTFMFLGPTGVGKTELARAVAEFLFDDERAMVRIDMGEYQEKHTVARLIGAPPGYVGYDEGGQLTEAVRRRPYSVVLLDELEKAHHDVFNVLLQLLDDGRLTDGQGRTVDFTNVVLIMTSNLQGDPNAFFRPEFVNRLDEIVTFRHLTRDDLRHIVDIQLDALDRRLQQRRVTLRVTDEAKDVLATNGFDEVFGARPLKRLIQKEIGDRLAIAILEGKVGEGDTATVDVVDGDLVLK